VVAILKLATNTSSEIDCFQVIYFTVHYPIRFSEIGLEKNKSKKS